MSQKVWYVVLGCLFIMTLGTMKAENTHICHTNKITVYDLTRYEEMEEVAYAKLPKLLLRMASKSRHIAGSELPAHLLKSLDYVAVVAADTPKGRNALMEDALKVANQNSYDFIIAVKEGEQDFSGYYNACGDVIEEILFFIKEGEQQMIVQIVGSLNIEEMRQLVEVFRNKKRDDDESK